MPDKAALERIARDLLHKVKSGERGFGTEAATEIATVLLEVAERNRVSARMIGRIIQHRSDRIVKGTRIGHRPLKDRAA